MSARLRLPMPKNIRGRGPTLSTQHEIEVILRKASGPISLNEIKRRMRARAVRHEAVRQTVDEFARLGLVVIGSKGVLWTVNPSHKLWEPAGWTPLR